MFFATMRRDNVTRFFLYLRFTVLYCHHIWHIVASDTTQRNDTARPRAHKFLMLCYSCYFVISPAVPFIILCIFVSLFCFSLKFMLVLPSF